MAEPAATRTHRVASLSVLALVSMVLDRGFSLALIALVAALYGVSAATDAYYLALIVPAAVAFALTEAVYTVLVPFFDRPGGLTRRSLRAAELIAVPLALAVTAAYLLAVVAARPTHESVWLAFAGLIAAQPVVALYVAFFTAQGRYGLVTLRVPFVSALALAAALALLTVWSSIAAIAAAVSIGHAVQPVVLAAVAYRERLPRGERVSASPRRLAAPAASVFFATLLGGQLVVLIERFLAAALATGAVTLLANARGFVMFAAIAAQALGTGVFPAAAERFRAGAAALAGLALAAVRLAAVIALVAAAYIVVCRRQLLDVVLVRGKFDAEDAREAARLMTIMAPALLGISVGAVASKALYGTGRQRLVAVVTGGGIALYAALALSLREVWGVDGLAAAFAISSLATGLVLAASLARLLALPARTAVRNWLLAPVALALAFAAGAACSRLACDRLPEGLGRSLVTLVAAGAGGLAVLAGAVVLTRASEYELVRNAWRRRSFRAAAASP